MDQSRSTQRYRPTKEATDRPLVDAMLTIARRRPRFGYRRVLRLLRRDGWRVGHDRIERLWRLHQLRVSRRTIRRRRLGGPEGGVTRLRAERMNQVWSYDFVKDQTTDGRPLKILTVVDEFTRECLAIVVARSIRSGRVIETLDELVSIRGAPEHMRSDNGPEFIAHRVRSWLESRGTRTAFIEPGAPWENAFGESFNGKLRDECLNLELFTSLSEARVVIDDFRLDFNHRRPHSSLGYLTPAEYAARERERAGPSLRLAALACASDQHAGSTM